MRSPLLLIPVTVLIVHCFALPFAGSFAGLHAQDPPKLVTEPARYEFGEILSGEKLYREIKLINAGGEKLVVKRIDFSCGCTIPKIELSTGEEVVPNMEEADSFATLGPNEWALIKLEFQSLGRFGQVKHRMDIYTNDPKGQVRHIPIVAQIRRAFLLNPPTVDFGLVDKNKAAHVLVRVESNQIGDFSITGISGLPFFMDYTVEEADDGDAGGEGAANEATGEPAGENSAPHDSGDDAKNPAVMLKLKYLGSAPLGKQVYSLKVQVDHPKVTDLKLFTEMRVIPSIAFIYEGQRFFDMVDLGNLSRTEPKVADIMIKNQDLAYAFNVSNVVCKSLCDPPVETLLTAIKPGMEYKVTLTIPPQKKGRVAHGRIIISSDHPELPQASVRFKGFYMDSRNKRKKGKPQDAGH